MTEVFKEWWPFCFVLFGLIVLLWQISHLQAKLMEVRKMLLDDKDKEIERLRQEQLQLLEQLKRLQEQP